MGGNLNREGRVNILMDGGIHNDGRSVGGG